MVGVYDCQEILQLRMDELEPFLQLTEAYNKFKLGIHFAILQAVRFMDCGGSQIRDY